MFLACLYLLILLVKSVIYVIYLLIILCIMVTIWDITLCFVLIARLIKTLFSRPLSMGES